MALTQEEIKWYKSFTAALRLKGLDPNDKVALSKILAHQDMSSFMDKLNEYSDVDVSEAPEEMQNKILGIIMDEQRVRFVPAFTRPYSDGLMRTENIDDTRNASQWLEEETISINEEAINPDGTGLRGAEEAKVKALFDLAKKGRLYYSPNSLAENENEYPIVVNASGEAVIKEYSLADLNQRIDHNEVLNREETMISEPLSEKFKVLTTDAGIMVGFSEDKTQKVLRLGYKTLNRSRLATDMMVRPELYTDAATRAERIAEVELEFEQELGYVAVSNREIARRTEADYAKEAAEFKGEAVATFLSELYSLKDYKDARKRCDSMNRRINAYEELLAKVPEEQTEKRQRIQTHIDELSTPDGREKKIRALKSRINAMKELKDSGNKAISSVVINPLQELLGELENYEADREIVDKIEDIGGYFSGRRTFEKKGALPSDLSAFLSNELSDINPSTDVYEEAKELHWPNPIELRLDDLEFTERVWAMKVESEDYLPIYLEELTSERLKAIANNITSQRFSANVLVDGEPLLQDLADADMDQANRQQEFEFVSRKVAEAVLYGKKVQIIPTHENGRPMDPINFVPTPIPALDEELVRLRANTHFNLFNEKDPQKAVSEVGDLLKEAQRADRFVLFGKGQFDNMLTAMDELNTLTQELSQSASSASVQQMEEYRKALDKANQAAEAYIEYKGLEGKNDTEVRRINAALAIQQYTSEKMTSVRTHISGIMTEKFAGKNVKTQEMKNVLKAVEKSNVDNRVSLEATKKATQDNEIVAAVTAGGMSVGHATRRDSFSANAVEYYRQSHDLKREDMLNMIHNHPERLNEMYHDYAKFMKDNAVFDAKTGTKQMLPSDELSSHIKAQATFYKNWYEQALGGDTLQDYFDLEPKAAFENIIYDLMTTINVSQNEQTMRKTYRKDYTEAFGGIEFMDKLQSKVGIKQFLAKCAYEMYADSSRAFDRLAAKVNYTYIMDKYKGKKLDEIPSEVTGFAGMQKSLSSTLLDKYSEQDVDMYLHDVAIPEIKVKIDKDIAEYLEMAQKVGKDAVYDDAKRLNKIKTNIAKEECADKLYNAYMDRLKVMKSESAFQVLSTANGRNAFMDVAMNSKLVGQLVESPEKMNENPQKLVDQLVGELAPKELESAVKAAQKQEVQPQRVGEIPVKVGP